MHAGLCRGNLRQGDILKDIGVGIGIILKLFFKNWMGERLD